MPDDLTAPTSRLRRTIQAALSRLLTQIRVYMSGHSWEPPDDVDEATAAAWQAAIQDLVAPELALIITAAATSEVTPRGLRVPVSDSRDWADEYLSTVDNRLVGIADTTWGIIRDSLREGRSKGESISELTARVDDLLGDAPRWKRRAETIARTEVIGANSAGHYAAAGWTADQLGVDHADVVKGWLDTHDTRTRATHRAAGGQHVKGLDARFTVGEARMLRPHDPAGPPGEVIECRCSTLYLMPGDPGYDDALTAGGTMPHLARPNGYASVLSRLVDRAILYGMDPALAARLVEVFDVSRMPPKLKAYWLTHTAWGHPGDFKECQVALRKYLPARMVDGACANLHNEATGHYPGPGRGVSADTDAYAMVLADKQPVKRPPIPVQPDGSVKPEHLPDGAEPTPSDPEDQDDPPTTVVVVALPAEDDDVQMIGPEDKHATLLFYGKLGEVDALTDDYRATLEETLTTYAAGAAPVVDTVTKVDTLGDDEALVWMLAGDTIPQVRADITATDSEAVPPDSVEQHPSFTPHVTIGYPADQTDDTQDDAWPAIRDAAADVQEIRFDRVALWWGTDRREYPLTGGQDPAPADTPPGKQEDNPVTAAATETPATDDTAGQEGEPVLRWTGVLCPEGIVTGDKRKFADGALQWFVKPGTPIVLKAMFADKPGHDDSVPVGLIESIERRDGKLHATGTWDSSKDAVEARRQNIKGLLRGVSVDLDDIQMHLEDADGNPIEGDDIFDLIGGEEPTLTVDTGRIRAATLWSIPAFVDAYVLDESIADQIPDTSLVDAPADEESPLAIAASGALTAAVAVKPTAAPASAFADPGLTEPTRLTITADGRIFGHLACWGVCHIGIDGACIVPPHSAVDYAHMLTGMYATSDGEVLPVGTLTMGTGHADLELGWRPTVDHYDNTGTAAAYFNIGEDDIGIWMAGALDEYLPEPQRLALMRAGSVSGDWREIGGSLELVAALAVNVPGFPIPAVRARTASGAQRALVASGVVHPPEQPTPAVDIAALAREVVAYQNRADRSAAADRRLREQRARQLAARL